MLQIVDKHPIFTYFTLSLHVKMFSLFYISDMTTVLFSPAVRQFFLSLLAGCSLHFTFLRRRRASRNSPPEMVFVCKMRSTLVNPC